MEPSNHRNGSRKVFQLSDPPQAETGCFAQEPSPQAVSDPDFDKHFPLLMEKLKNYESEVNLRHYQEICNNESIPIDERRDKFNEYYRLIKVNILKKVNDEIITFAPEWRRLLQIHE